MMAQEVKASHTQQLKYAIAIHGGAGSSPRDYSKEVNLARRNALDSALRTGVRIVANGGSALDAVEAVVRRLEDDPHFNAGRGAVVNAVGGHELDACIMDGRTKGCGAVAGVRTVKNPIGLARLVMMRTNHVLLAGIGADKFAEEMGVELVDQEYFYTKKQHDAWQKAKKRSESQPASLKDSKGTVGCVVLDTHGNLAAATSTGGLTNKRFGRIGDVPIVGAGTYADNRSCAVSCTGIGEIFIRHVIAYDVSARMLYKGASLGESIDEVFASSLKPNEGGLIAVSRSGKIEMRFNTADMARAAADSSGRFDVFWGESSDEDK
jgi:beta-aspartyl-peptidase (threonine type)